VPSFLRCGMIARPLSWQKKELPWKKLYAAALLHVLSR